LAELSRQRQLQTDLEGLLARKTGQVERLARLKSEAGKARQDLEALGNIEERRLSCAVRIGIWTGWEASLTASFQI